MQREPKRRTTGIAGALGGVDMSRNPSLLTPDQIAYGENLTVRGGYMETRPGKAQIGLSFETTELADWFLSHRLQGAGFYQHKSGGYPVLMALGGGRLVRIDLLNHNMVNEITPTLTASTTANFSVPAIDASVVITLDDASHVWIGYPILINGKRYQVTAKTGNNITATNKDDTGTTVNAGATVVFLDVNHPDQPQAWMVQAEEFLIVQNGLDTAMIYNGAATRRADSKMKEVPTGTVMAYGQGRLVVARANRSEFLMGDIAGGPTGVLKFTENDYLNEGGAFKVPVSAGLITAMVFPSNLDSSLGQGPLQVFTESAVFSVNAPVNRESWKTLTNPIQTVSIIDDGASSQAGTVLVNGDIFFRGLDGLRSFVLARRDFGMWGNVPVSRELSALMDNDTEALLWASSAMRLHNRLLFTIGPRPSPVGVYHESIGVLDFDLLSSLRDQAPPTFDGVWTGIQPLLLVKGRFDGRERGFAFARNADNKVELWEITKGARFENTDGRIKSVAEGRSTGFALGNPLMKLEGAELFVDRLAGEVTFTLKYRPDQYPFWVDWDSKTVTAKYRDCDLAETGQCKTLTEYKDGYKTRLAFKQPPDVNEPNDGKPMRLGYEFQWRLEWEGHARVKKLLLHAIETQEDPFAE